MTTTSHVAGLTEAEQDCAVVVFSDADFISDGIAYQSSFFGKAVVGDNAALMLNAIDDLSGSTDLLSIRSRGNFKRPFTIVDEIERQAEAETAQEVEKINLQIAGFQGELQSILSSAKEGQEEVIGNSIVQKKQQVELKIHQAQRHGRVTSGIAFTMRIGAAFIRYGRVNSLVGRSGRIRETCHGKCRKNNYRRSESRSAN